MNIHTFKDVANAKRSALINELDDDDGDDDHEVTKKDMRREVDGEEETGTEAFNEFGEAIEPFNMKNEREGGHIDENMNYVFQKERGEVDAWVAGMDETAMEKSIGEAAMAMQKKIAKQEVEDAKEASRVRKTTLQLRKEILLHLQPGETLIRCMKRLGGKDEKSRGNTAFKRKTQLANKALGVNTEPEAVVLSSEEAKLQAKRNREIIHIITENADELLAAGLTGIYEMSFESLEASTLLWEYKGLDEVVYGPYTAQQISQWKAQGYLTGPTAVLIRKCGEVQPVVGSIESGYQSAAAAAVATTSSKKRGGGGGIYDDDDFEEPAAKKSKVTFDQGVTTSTGTANSAPSEFVKGEWVSSDEVDFGVFVDLDEYDRQQNRKAASGGNSKGSDSRHSHGGRGGGAASGGRHNQHQQRRAGEEHKDSMSEDDDNDDNDGDDQDGDDPWAQKAAIRARSGGVNREADGSDEDD